MRRRTTSSTAILLLASRRPAIPIPFAPSGCRCARRAPSARAMLVQAAAQQWQVEPASCTTANGAGDPRRQRPQAFLWRPGAKREQSDAAEGRPPLKDPKDFTLIGKPLKRLDTPDKINGKVVYGIDAMLPGMKFATLAQCPVFGGKVGHVDDKAAKAVPGRAAGGRARRSGRGRRRSHVGGEEGSRCPRHHLGRGSEREDQLEGHLGRSARGERKGRRSSRRPRATSPRAWRRASSSRRPTNCRFSPTRRWNR